MRHIAQREDIRDLILDGVDGLLAQYGYRKMTMEDLALQVGIGKGTIYLHFPSKEELTLSHIDRIAERLLQQLKEIARTVAPAEDRIKKMLLARVMFRFDSVRHYSRNLSDLLSSLRKDLLVRRERHFQQEMNVIAGVLEEGRMHGFFEFADAQETAQILIWCTNSLLPFSLTTRELGSRKDIERRISSISDLLVDGLRKQEKSERKIRNTKKMRNLTQGVSNVG